MSRDHITEVLIKHVKGLDFFLEDNRKLLKGFLKSSNDMINVPLENKFDQSKNPRRKVEKVGYPHLSMNKLRPRVIQNYQL